MPITADLPETEVIKLDQVDRDILHILQFDGRSSASHIADEIGMSIPAVTDRIKKSSQNRIYENHRIFNQTHNSKTYLNYFGCEINILIH